MSIMSIDKIKEGLQFLGIKDPETISYIIDSQKENYLWSIEQDEIKEIKEVYKSRFKIPKGLKKKDLKVLLETTSDLINKAKEQSRKNSENVFHKIEVEDWIEKKKKINLILKNHKHFGSGEEKLRKAKEYPIDQLIEFNGHGFAKCLWHNERSPSLKYYRDTNTVYCFSCHNKHDAIDVYQILNGVNTSQAINNLWK